MSFATTKHTDTVVQYSMNGKKSEDMKMTVIDCYFMR